MSVVIPQAYKNAIGAMASIGATARLDLLHALDAAPAASSMEQLVAHLASATAVATEAVRATLATTASLIASSEGEPLSDRKALATGVAEAAAREGIGGLTADDRLAVTGFAEFLHALLDRTPVIEVAAKVASLLYDHKCIYVASRILTDFRPLFDEVDKPSELQAGVIFHTLRLTTLADGEHQALYVVLDSTDLFSLRHTVERAIAKDRLLRERLEALQLPLFHPGG